MFALIICGPGFLFAQWSPVRFDQYNYFNKITTVTANTAIASGITGGGTFFLRTNDGGITWDSISTNTPWNTYSFIELNFTDVNNGYAGGLNNSYQVLLKTIDNGSIWTDVTPDPASIDPVGSVSFLDPMNGYASNGTDIYRTTDGGQGWTSVNAGFNVKDIAFTDMDHGYACGSLSPDAVVMKTIDGGQTWNNVLSVSLPFFIGTMLKVDVINPDVVFSAGEYSNILFRTIDGGITWDTLNLSMIFQVEDFDFISASEGHLVSSMGEIFVTTDGGLTWTMEYSVASGAYGPLVFLKSLSFVGSTGYVCGSNGLIKKHSITPTGLLEAAGQSLITMYPNPAGANDIITISGITGQYVLEIFNTSGQFLMSRQSDGKSLHKNFNLTSGIYTVKIATPAQIVYKKLVVVN